MAINNDVTCTYLNRIMMRKICLQFPNIFILGMEPIKQLYNEWNMINKKEIQRIARDRELPIKVGSVWSTPN